MRQPGLLRLGHGTEQPRQGQGQHAQHQDARQAGVVIGAGGEIIVADRGVKLDIRVKGSGGDQPPHVQSLRVLLSGVPLLRGDGKGHRTAGGRFHLPVSVERVHGIAHLAQNEVGPHRLVGLLPDLAHVLAADVVPDGHVPGVVEMEADAEILIPCSPVPGIHGHVRHIFSGGVVLDDIVITAIEVREIRLHDVKVFLHRQDVAFQVFAIYLIQVVELPAVLVFLQLLFVQDSLIYIALHYLLIQEPQGAGFLEGYGHVPLIALLRLNLGQHIQQGHILLPPILVQDPLMPLVRLQVDVHVVKQLPALGIAQVAVEHVAVLVQPGDVVRSLYGIFLELLRPGAEYAVEAAEYGRKAQADQNPSENPRLAAAQPPQAPGLPAAVGGSAIWLPGRLLLHLFPLQQSHSALLLSLPSSARRLIPACPLPRLAASPLPSMLCGIPAIRPQPFPWHLTACRFCSPRPTPPSGTWDSSGRFQSSPGCSAHVP